MTRYQQIQVIEQALNTMTELTDILSELIEEIPELDIKQISMNLDEIRSELELA